MEKRNTMLLTVVAIATLLVAVVGATFAYFTATGTLEGSSDVEVVTSSHDTTTATGTNVSLLVTAAMMQEDDGNNNQLVFHTAPTAGLVTLATSVGSGGGTSVCTYDLVYTPSVGAVFNVSSNNNAGSGGPYKELTLLYKATTQDYAQIPEGYTNDAEQNLAGISTATNLVSNTTLTVSGANKQGSVTWNIRPRFYNLGINQDSVSGKTFGGTVSIENLSCENTGT